MPGAKNLKMKGKVDVIGGEFRDRGSVASKVGR